MEMLHKEKYTKPIEARVADLGIMLECLHEVYESEENLLRFGKILRSTMAYPFIKMVESQCRGIPAKEIHQLLWNIYLTEKEKTAFMIAAKERLEACEKGAAIS